MTTTLVDTGFLVALFRGRERFNGAAKAYLTRNRQPLLTVTPVVVETAFFLAAEENPEKPLIRMSHLLSAVRREFQKQGRLVMKSDLGQYANSWTEVPQ